MYRNIFNQKERSYEEIVKMCEFFMKLSEHRHTTDILIQMCLNK